MTKQIHLVEVTDRLGTYFYEVQPDGSREPVEIYIEKVDQTT